MSLEESRASFRRLAVVTLEYQLADGSVERSPKIGVGRRLSVDSTHPLYYDPKRPKRFAVDFDDRYPEHFTERVWRWFSPIVGVLFLVLGVVALASELL